MARKRHEPGPWTRAVGPVVQRLRTDADMSKSALERATTRAGKTITRNALADIEAGKRSDIFVDEIGVLGDVFGVSVDVLIGRGYPSRMVAEGNDGDDGGSGEGWTIDVDGTTRYTDDPDKVGQVIAALFAVDPAPSNVTITKGRSGGGNSANPTSQGIPAPRPPRREQRGGGGPQPAPPAEAR